ncbi:MAG: anhydro-N-acetylmuramic acid kinase [Mariniphaga sp.]
MNILAIGVMSGTSLDGIDIALCHFSNTGAKWSYEIVEAQTFNYEISWADKLKMAPALTPEAFMLLHNEYGRYTGELINGFLQGKEIPRIIASHGHTIFHQPERKLTFQIGNGASIAAKTGITTVSDFRTYDLALGGQGAPLVPVGDQLLFPEFDYCLNIGGFANISFESKGQRIASDISPANIVLNELAQQKGQPFDRDGQLGSAGSVDQLLLHQLNKLDFYQKKWPKSLGREWVDHQIMPLLSESGLSVEDQAATFYEHIACEISAATGLSGQLLVTGGGAKNLFLIEKLRQKCTCNIVLPDEKLIDFKEALIFAFLGVLSFTRQVNILSSITGSSRDHIGGIVHLV